MKGNIEEISEGESRTGQKYLRLTIDGQRYMFWDEKRFDQLHEGDVVEFTWMKSGNGFRKIAEIQVVENGNSNGRRLNFDRNSTITKLACLKASCTLLSGLEMDAEEKTKKAIEVAKQFEEYANGSAAPEANE